MVQVAGMKGRGEKPKTSVCFYQAFGDFLLYW